MYGRHSRHSRHPCLLDQAGRLSLASPGNEMSAMLCSFHAVFVQHPGAALCWQARKQAQQAQLGPATCPAAGHLLLLPPGCLRARGGTPGKEERVHLLQCFICAQLLQCFICATNRWAAQPSVA